MEKILFLTRSLDAGGAERQLSVLAENLKNKKKEVTILTFYPNGQLEEKIKDTGIKIESLNKKGRWDIFGFLFRLFKFVRREKPDVIHGYLAVSNIIALLTRFMLLFSGKKVKIVWGVRASYMDLSQYDKLSRLSYMLEKSLSNFADLIIANSKAGKDYYAKKGFPEKKMIVIPNGIDTQKFLPQPERKDIMCKVWGIEPEKIIVGMGARLDPIKDHVSFFKAAKILHKKYPNVLFVCVGGGSDENYSKQLRTLVSQLEINDCIVWAGYCGDMPAAYSTFDVAVSSSKGEGFPNVVGEAMACGVPCVVTDVGDSSWIVGNAGHSVPSGDPKALADAIEPFIIDEQKRKSLGEKARARISEKFSTELLTSRFLKALDNKQLRH